MEDTVYTNGARRLIALVILVMALSGLAYAYLRNSYAYTLPIEGVSKCSAGMQNVGMLMDSCEKVNNTQAWVTALSVVLTTVIAMLMIALLRGKTLWAMISQVNAVDNNNSPAKLLIFMVGAGYLFTGFLKVSSVEIMLFTMMLRMSAFFLLGTPTAVVANVLLHGDVPNVPEWIKRFELPGTDGPVYITMLGFAFGLLWAMSLM